MMVLALLLLLVATPAVADVECPDGGLVGTATATTNANAVGPYRLTGGVTDYSITYKNTGAGAGTAKVITCCTGNCGDLTAADWVDDINFGSPDAVGAGLIVTNERTGMQAVPPCQQRVSLTACTSCNIEVWLRCLVR